MASIEQTLRTATQRLTSLSDSARLDSELLLAHCLQQSRTYLFTWPENRLTETQQACFDSLLAKRETGHPIAHLLGNREFWGLNLQVTADTLIPRPDTEILIETVLSLYTDSQAALNIVDLGTGTGAIALALKSEYPNSQVIALDQSPAALKVAQQNSQKLGLNITTLHSNWFSALDQTTDFDLIVSNPPYIEENDPHLSQGDVRFEPLSALVAADNGLQDLHTIITDAKSRLAVNGWLMLEHGYNQADAVQALLQQHGYQQVHTVNDYGNNPRITLGQHTCEKP